MGCCDSVIYYKKYMFGLHPGPGTELLKPLEFPVVKAQKMSFMLMR